MNKEVSESRGKKQKNPTYNYAKDSHKAFCERCLKFNQGCPNTGTVRTDRSCTL